MPKRDFFRSAIHKTYAAQRYRNPYFQRTKPRPWKPLAGLAAGCFVFCGLVAFFLGSPYFAYDTVTIEGTETVAPEELRSIANTYLADRFFLFFQRSNRFLFDSTALENRLKERFAFETLEVKTEGKGIRVTVKEKTSQLLWQSGDVTYLVALDGIVIRAVAEAELTVPVASTDPAIVPPQNPLLLLPVFVDLTEAAVTVGGAVMTPEEVTNVFRFHEQLIQQSITFIETRLDRKIGKWAAVQTTAGYAILFDPLGDIDRQSINLATVLRETIPDPTRLEYVDLRFEDHIYYKQR